MAPSKRKGSKHSVCADDEPNVKKQRGGTAAKSNGKAGDDFRSRGFKLQAPPHGCMKHVTGKDCYGAKQIWPGPLMSYFHLHTGFEGQQVAYRELFQNACDQARKANGGWEGLSIVFDTVPSGRHNARSVYLCSENKKVIYAQVRWEDRRLMGYRRPFKYDDSKENPTFRHMSGVADGRVITFINYGVGKVPLSMLWLGHSNKRQEPGAIGAYGEGLKHAIVVLSREQLEHNDVDAYGIPNTVRINMLNNRGTQTLFATPEDVMCYFRRAKRDGDDVEDMSTRPGDFSVVITGPRCALAEPSIDSWLFKPHQDDLVFDGVGIIRPIVDIDDPDRGRVYSNRFLVEQRRWLRHTVVLFDVLPTRERNSFPEDVRCNALAKLWSHAVVESELARRSYLDILQNDSQPFEEINALESLSVAARTALVKEWFENRASEDIKTGRVLFVSEDSYDDDVMLLEKIKIKARKGKRAVYKLVARLPHSAPVAIPDANTLYQEQVTALCGAQPFVPTDSDQRRRVLIDKVKIHAIEILGEQWVAAVRFHSPGENCKILCARANEGDPNIRDWIVHSQVLDAKFAHDLQESAGGQRCELGDECLRCPLYMMVYEILWNAIYTRIESPEEKIIFERRARRTMFDETCKVSLGLADADVPDPIHEDPQDQEPWEWEEPWEAPTNAIKPKCKRSGKDRSKDPAHVTADGTEELAATPVTTTPQSPERTEAPDHNNNLKHSGDTTPPDKVVKRAVIKPTRKKSGNDRSKGPAHFTANGNDGVAETPAAATPQSPERTRAPGRNNNLRDCDYTTPPGKADSAGSRPESKSGEDGPPGTKGPDLQKELAESQANERILREKLEDALAKQKELEAQVADYKKVLAESQATERILKEKLEKALAKQKELEAQVKRIVSLLQPLMSAIP